MNIHNCHIHLFTVDHVPDHFINPTLMEIADTRWVGRPLGWIMRQIGKLGGPTELAERYGRFLSILENDTQEEAFDVVRRRYPPNTRFVVLPMDMSQMGAGTVKVNIYQQHEELAALRDKFPDAIIPFAAIEPRRRDVIKIMRHAIEDLKFKGIKLYPPLGYPPNDPVLMSDVYPYCVEHKLPVTAHCSQGGVKGDKGPTDGKGAFADPARWREVLDTFKTLKVDLAHFGGIDDWKSCTGLQSPTPEPAGNWLAEIITMIRSGNFPNLYTDIAYTEFFPEEVLPSLQPLLTDPRVAEHVLFGSDFYMAEQEAPSEREVMGKVRQTLGETVFQQIAETNPQRFLS